MSVARPIFWPAISPLALHLAPRMQAYMRDDGARGFKAWLYKTFLDPYTNVSAARLVATSVFASRFEGKLSNVVQRAVFHFGVFEPNLTAWIRAHLKPGDVFVDVGANVGYFSLLASRMVGKDGRVIALEPAPSTFAVLEHNILLNKAENVRAVRVAAYDRIATLPMYSVAGEEAAGGASLVHVVGPQEAEVSAAPLGDVLTSEELRRARLIKIDVEGAEESVVAGLLPLLDQLRDDAELVIELLPTTFAAVVECFAKRGFYRYLLKNPMTPLDGHAGPAGVATRIPNHAREPATYDMHGVAYVIFSRRDAESI
jgi:FkbM family methyltransferase